MGDSKRGKDKAIIEKERKYIMQTYKRQPLVVVEGRGAILKDIHGREYIDCVAGIAVNNVGHCHPVVVEAIKKQAERLIHTSNLYYTELQVELAEKLVEISGMERVFFCNSGAESVEAALKLVRKATGRKKIIAAEGSFHGRTFGALSVTFPYKYRKGFEPLMGGVEFVPYGDAESIRRVIDDDTAAVILEPIQGEAGVRVPPEGYLREVREICDDKGVLLVLDEIQTGFGRTGRWFCKDHEGVEPDIMTVAKAMGGGFPIGAMLSHGGIEFGIGEHASTFGGNPLACAASLAAIKVIEEENLVERARELGGYVMRRLSMEVGDGGVVKEIRGKGLMIGIELKEPCGGVVERALEEGVLINCTEDYVIRLVPPLVIGKEEVERVVSVLQDVLSG
ncbi:MAG: acetylornithine transaminase [Candidatus Methanospirareceae archaeon]